MHVWTSLSRLTENKVKNVVWIQLEKESCCKLPKILYNFVKKKNLFLQVVINVLGTNKCYFHKEI